MLVNYLVSGGMSVYSLFYGNFTCEMLFGAPAVLVALWRIHDEATQEFMEHFYAKLCQGTFVCKALKETINMFQQHEKYKSFSYWAPFEILGEDVKFTKKEIDEIRIRNSQT